ncbi:hypothetical protein ACJ5H2_04860 [Nocardioides sp. R1-1]|uniref:hypothetical protein n=1 Tax=Nocardioides sp. R1-1 TaxID=3383502 RepID=UPI0038D0472C
MYGDTRVIRRLATRMDERAVELCAAADRLVSAADRLVSAADRAQWWSVGGDRMRVQVRDRATRLRAVATEYEEAAERLRAHAAEVDELTALIAAIERRVSSLVEGAVERLRAAGHALVEGLKDGARAVGSLLTGGSEPDPRDVRLAQYAGPPSGGKAWLDVPEQLGIRV